MVTCGKDEERNIIKKRHFAYIHTYTQTHNIVGAKRLGVLKNHIPQTCKNSLVAVISLRIRTMNMRPLEKYEGVKTVLVTPYAFLRKH